jgi:putative addiction module component (TIGR02574 family)
MSIDAILKEAESLSPEEQVELIRRLEAGLVAAGWEPVAELSDEMKGLLDRRNAAADAHPGDALTWEQVVEYVKRKK